MITLIRTDASHPSFKNLIKHLDVYLAKMDGDAHEFFSQYNTTENLNEVVLAFKDEQAVACGAFKPYDANTVEIKRMYVDTNCRGEGLATKVLLELEVWAKSQGFTHAILETGTAYKDAIALYQKNGYQKIPNYDQYIGSDLSTCFKKELN
ncbi:GNAT family N-acetyltransferase [Joostella sp. CR20]|uniref:GNAT family N-acetyltransferase n=1 Tax=Joostella sp. CR20 TaxID=2804312 RepID=UPI00313DBEAB